MSLDPKVTQSLTKVNYKAYLERGQQKLKNGDFDGAIKDYEKSLSLQPSFLSYLCLGAAFYKIGKYESSVNALISSLKYKKSWTAYNFLGWSYLNQKNYVEAIKSFQNSINLRKDSENLYGLAICLLRSQKNNKLGLNFIQQSLAMNDIYSRRIELISLFLGNREYSRAIEAIDEASNLASNWQLLQWKGICFLYLNQFTDSIEVLKQSISLLKHQDSYLWLGRSYVKVGEIQKAIESFHHSLSLQETSTNCLELGKAYNRVGDFIKGAEYFRKSIKLGALSAAHDGLAISLASQGQTKEALEAANQSLLANNPIASFGLYLGGSVDYIHLNILNWEDLQSRCDSLGYEFHRSTQIDKDKSSALWNNLMYLHVPKCAGSSFKAPIYSCFENLIEYKNENNYSQPNDFHLNTRGLISTELHLNNIYNIANRFRHDGLKSIFFTTAKSPPPSWYETFCSISNLVESPSRILVITRNPSERLFSHIKWESCHFDYETMIQRIENPDCILNNTMNKFIYQAPFSAEISKKEALDLTSRFYFIDMFDNEALSSVKSSFLSSASYPNIVQVKKMNDGRHNKSNLSDNHIQYLYEHCVSKGFLDIDQKLDFESLHNKSRIKMRFCIDEPVSDTSLHPLTFVAKNNSNNFMGSSGDGFIVPTIDFIKRPEYFLG
jgi:tetratricopeptide (TPR) repeat protein